MFLAFFAPVYSIGENFDLKKLIMFLYGIVTAGFLIPCTVRLQAIGKTKESRFHILCPQNSMSWW